jgi:ankyrin repeat protein
MDQLPSSSGLVPQRMVRPLNVPPGFWKQQLARKYLEIAVQGDMDRLRQLLSIHPEFLNKRGSHNRTLLWEAVRRRKLSLVQWLVEQGSEIDATGCYNNESFVQLTPYCAAVFYKRPDVANYLQSRGTQIDIFRAAFLGDIGHVSRELAANQGLIHAEDPHDTIYYVPLLAFAVAGGKIEMLEFLLDRGAVVEPYSAELVGLAAKDRRIDILDLLVKHHAQVAAAGFNTYDFEILRYLLDHGASPTQKHENGFPPLVYLCRGDKGEHPEKIKLLLEHHAAVNALGPKGRTALHYAAAAGFLEVMTILLDHGADFTIRDEQGETPLLLARRNKRTAAANLLENVAQGNKPEYKVFNAFSGSPLRLVKGD